jgi:spermidine synthase
MTINQGRRSTPPLVIQEKINRLVAHQAALKPSLILFSSGVNLILVQWVLTRELTALLLGTELVILLVSISYFIGLSAGYKLSRHFPRALLIPLGIITLILHLTLPIWFRLLVVATASMNAFGLSYIVLPLLTPFLISAFYSIFLPLLLDNREGQPSTLYSMEVIGSVFGVLVLVFMGSSGLQAVYFIYMLGLACILLMLGLAWHWTFLLTIAGVIWLLILPRPLNWSNALWYETVHELPPGTTTLFSAYSPYQKVDVMQTPAGKHYLFLDGLEHFGDVDGERLNVIMGTIPSALAKPENALVLGAGSMQMEAFIADHAGHVTTVEIDPVVVEASIRYLTAFNRMDRLDNRSIVIDDAKHFLANTQERYDLIAMDLPAAYSIQTATLYSLPLYQAAADHLKPDGVFVANLTSAFEQDDIVSRRIAAGLLATFDEVIIVTPESVGWSFAYAGDDLPFDRHMIETALRDNGEIQFIIFDTPAVRVFVGDAQPITLDSMDLVLHTSADWIGERFGWDD